MGDGGDACILQFTTAGRTVTCPVGESFPCHTCLKLPADIYRHVIGSSRTPSLPEHLPLQFSQEGGRRKANPLYSPTSGSNGDGDDGA